MYSMKGRYMKGNPQNAINLMIYQKELLLVVTDTDKIAPQPLDIISLLKKKRNYPELIKMISNLFTV